MNAKPLTVLIGNYGSTNLGDDLYMHLLRQRYPDWEFTWHRELGKRRPNRIIYGGGGLLRTEDARIELLREWVEKFEVPYGIMSVGTGSRLPPSMSFPDASFVTVRDEQAHACVEGSVLLPDLAWTYSPADSAQSSQPQYMGIMLRHSLRHNSFELVRKTRELMADIGGPYFFISTYGERLRDRRLELTTAAGFRPDVRREEYWGSIDAYLSQLTHCRRMVVMPYHGILMSCLFGITFGGYSYSDKTDGLAREIGAELPRDLSSAIVWNRPDAGRIAAIVRRAEAHYRYLDDFFRLCPDDYSPDTGDHTASESSQPAGGAQG